MIDVMGSSCSALNINCREPSGLNSIFWLWNESFSGDDWWLSDESFIYYICLTRDDTNECFDTWDKRTGRAKSRENAICWWYTKIFTVAKGSTIVREWAPTSGDQFRPGIPSLDAHVTREAYVIEYWELRPEGRTVLSALIQCISRDTSWFGEQCSLGKNLACVSKLCPLELKLR